MLRDPGLGSDSEGSVEEDFELDRTLLSPREVRRPEISALFFGQRERIAPQSYFRRNFPLLSSAGPGHRRARRRRLLAAGDAGGACERR